MFARAGAAIVCDVFGGKRYGLAWGMEKAHALLGVDVPFHR